MVSFIWAQGWIELDHKATSYTERTGQCFDSDHAIVRDKLSMRFEDLSKQTVLQTNIET